VSILQYYIGSNGVTNHRNNSNEQQQQRREFFELLSRQDVEETQALNLGKFANIAGIGSTVIGVLSNLFHG
jgi:hypothetical protein